MTYDTLSTVLYQMGIVPPYQFIPLRRGKDTADCDVFQIRTGCRTYVLKKSSEQEGAVYETFLGTVGRIAPRLYRSAEVEGDIYLLLEYVPGEALRACTRPALTAVLDTLIDLQSRYWERRDLEPAGYGYPAGWKDCQSRAACLQDPDLESAYAVFLDLYANMPRTLCPDLRPSNILMQRNRAVLIDWAHAGILPYPVSLARLIACGEEDENAAFRLSALDREFAVHYYFTHFVLDKGISYEAYRRTLDYFLLAAYCEGIERGRGDPKPETAYRARRSLARAKELAQRLQYGWESAPF